MITSKKKENCNHIWCSLSVPSSAPSMDLNFISSAMAEANTFMVPENDITALEKALYAQQQLLQKLNNELDVERESASIAASEALSMILRLQGEKASLKMEASQYKRMAEQKMCHAEEALAVFEDLIYQREMEIASLEYQVQAYRYRLLSTGFNDLVAYEVKFPENLLMQRNDYLFSEKGANNSNIRRLNSVPPVSIKDLKTSIERKKTANSIQDSISGSAEGNTIQEKEIDDSEKKLSSCVSVDLNSCWDHIRRLDERIKELSDNKDLGRNRSTLLKGVTWSPTLFSQPSNPATEINGNSQEKEAIANSASSSGVQDGKTLESLKKEIRKLTMEFENRLGKPDSAAEESTQSPGKANSLSVNNMKKLAKPRSGMSNDRCISSAEYQQLSRRIERLERARNTATQEIVAEGEEELELLKEICEQLKSIQCEMKSLREKEKSIFPLEPSVDSLQEAMLYFWM